MNSTSVGQELIGWASSFILLLTICRQVYKQYKEGTSQGVSKWLFIGQLLAETGFVIYSWLVSNWVFVVTNALLIVSNFVGLWITFRHRRIQREKEASTASSHAA